MDSKLDPVYRALFRHAEHSGDRQDVRREEASGDNGRRKDDRERPDRPDPWQDDTVVSVTALRALLLNLLGTPAEASNPAPPPAAPRPSDPMAARAAGAYRQTAAHRHPDPAPITTAPLATGPAPGLTDDDIRIIRQLITDLDRLSTRQIDVLRIEKNGSFLHSLAAAAARALAGT